MDPAGLWSPGSEDKAGATSKLVLRGSTAAKNTNLHEAVTLTDEEFDPLTGTGRPREH